MAIPDILLTLKFGDQLFTDPRRIALLKGIATTGSLSQAAKLIGISYKTAWDAINQINQLSEQPFVLSSTGGKGGGGAELTPYAKRFIELYDLLTTLQHNAFNVLKDETIPLNDVLKVAAKLSLQSSARNQLYGSIIATQIDQVSGYLTVLLNDNQTHINVSITQSSVERLQLIKDKSVILLIKAPQIMLHESTLYNHLKVTIKQITYEQQWGELTLQLPSGVCFYSSHLLSQVQSLVVGQSIDISISPENIIIATL